jgi:hypothetical protein
MTFSIDFIIVAIFFIAIFVIGFLERKKLTIDDYWVNSRKTKKLVIVATVASTYLGVGAIISNAGVAGTHFLRHSLYKLIRPFKMPFGEYRRGHFKFGMYSSAIVRMNGLIYSVHQFSKILKSIRITKVHFELGVK